MSTKSRKLRIGIYAANEFPYPVPAGNIHGVITVAGALADGLTDRGHTVTYFCPTESRTRAHKQDLGYHSFINLPISHTIPRGHIRYQCKSFYAQQMARDIVRYLRRHPVDILHLHNSRDALPFMHFLPGLPKVVTIHDSLFIPHYRFFMQLYQHLPETYFLSISQRQQQGMETLPWFANVYNGTDPNLFTFNPTPDEHVLFSGRFVPEKGIDLALLAASQARRPIHVVGFFDQRVELSKEFKQAITVLLHQPHVRYTNRADYTHLPQYYGKAKAVLFPIQWEEAFGLVMIEAMACGTPVIAFKRGSVPEIIKDGKTGYIVRTFSEMVRAIKKINAIDRRACRAHVVKNFSLSKMVNRYESVYDQVLTDFKRRR